ncbi:MAG TPA: HAD hydrolase family protein [Bacteroidales bacterium]|nr:HAD hydrolase family protein [Bacteroidales bacterium]
MTNFIEDLRNIKAFIFDIDGVLSQQTIMLNGDGEPIRTINLRDGYALQLAVKKGYRIAVISGGNSISFKKRLLALGVKHIYLQCFDKKMAFNEFLTIEKLDPAEILYMGDDIPDYEAMNAAGIAVCPTDADSEIKQISQYISDRKGGEGCVRDVIEQVLRLHGNWMNHDAYIW